MVRQMETALKLHCGYFKGRIADNIVKRLIPYSPWLQNAVEIADRLSEQIEDLQKQLRVKNYVNDKVDGR